MSCFGLDVWGSSQNEYGRIRMVENFAPVRVAFAWIDVIYISFRVITVESFRFNEPISCSPSVELT